MGGPSYQPVDTGSGEPTTGRLRKPPSPEARRWCACPSSATFCKLAIAAAAIAGAAYYLWNTGAFGDMGLTSLGHKKSFHHEQVKSCPQACFANVAETCASDMCSKCEYTCKQEQCRFEEQIAIHKMAATQSQKKCLDWCGKGSNEHEHCSTAFCAPCAFCSPVTFRDLTDYYLPKSDPYWCQWKHSGRPYTNNDSPVFTDVNGDGLLDLFNTMHGHWPDQHGNDRWELAFATPYEAADKSQHIKYVPHSRRIQIQDDPHIPQDAHGRTMMDLDGDGILDIYVDQGGDQGQQDEQGAQARVSMLLWGQLDDDGLPKFVGGRQESINAGVDMYYGRGRINYILDANLDGYLDIFVFQDRNVLNAVTPGILLYNQGDRTWDQGPDDKAIKEYTRTMLVTDADGDGYAQEVVLNRNFCYPQRLGPEADPTHPEYGAYSQDVLDFCSSRPVGTTAVFKYNPSSNLMEQISPHYRNVSAENPKTPTCCPHGSFSTNNDCNANSMASADLDGDLLADLIVVYRQKMHIYYSSDRKPGELPIGQHTMGTEIYFTEACHSAATVRIVDIDNDGMEEIIVFCVSPVATVLVYTRASESGREWTLDNGANAPYALGDMLNGTLTRFTDKDYEDSCDVKLWSKINPYCAYQQKRGRKPGDPDMEGVSSVDLNNDGFVDFVVSYNFGYTRFFENVPTPTVAKNRFIVFRLIGAGPGKGSNVYGIGATLILQVKQGLRMVQQFKEISSHQHTPDWYGYKDERIVFGLGARGAPIKLLVRWPNGKEQTKPLDGWTFSGKVEVLDVVEMLD